MRSHPNYSGWQKGVSSAEFALILPLFLTMVFFVFGIALAGINVLWTATVVPVEARGAGIGTGTHNLTSAFLLSAEAGGPGIGASPTCQRAVLARLDAAPSLQVPMLPGVGIRLRAGSEARRWQFWPGPPTDDCE
jgi:hypothetical protein